MCCLEQCRHTSNGRCRQAGAVSCSCILLAGDASVIALLMHQSWYLCTLMVGQSLMMSKGFEHTSTAVLGCSCCRTSQVLTCKCWTYFASSKMKLQNPSPLHAKPWLQFYTSRRYNACTHNTFADKEDTEDTENKRVIVCFILQSDY